MAPEIMAVSNPNNNPPSAATKLVSAINFLSAILVFSVTLYYRVCLNFISLPTRRSSSADQNACGSSPVVSCIYERERLSREKMQSSLPGQKLFQHKARGPKSPDRTAPFAVGDLYRFAGRLAAKVYRPGPGKTGMRRQGDGDGTGFTGHFP